MLIKDLKIRVATPENAEAIALLARITFGETFSHYFRDKNDLLSYYRRTFSAEKIRNSIKKENNIFWIAFIDEIDFPIGYAKLKLNSTSEFLTDKKQSQLQKIYVLKDFLSKKVGLSLQNEVLKKASTVSDKIWLSVLNSNEKAIHFYTKTGFKPIGNHKYSIGKENFNFTAMAKQLNT